MAIKNKDKKLQAKAELLGEQIRNLRLKTGLSIVDFAAAVDDIDPVYITQIELHGKMPSPKIMKRILEKLNLAAGVKLYFFEQYLSIKHPELAELLEEFAKESMTPMAKENRKYNEALANKLLGNDK